MKKYALALAVVLLCARAPAFWGGWWGGGDASPFESSGDVNTHSPVEGDHTVAAAIDHGFIGGGTNNALTGTGYGNSILGGILNTVTNSGNHNVVFGTNNLMNTSGDYNLLGGRDSSVTGGGNGCFILGRLCGNGNYGNVFAFGQSAVGAGNYSGQGGYQVKSGSYGLVWGYQSDGTGANYTYGFGQRINLDHSGSVVFRAGSSLPAAYWGTGTTDTFTILATNGVAINTGSAHVPVAALDVNGTIKGDAEIAYMSFEDAGGATYALTTTDTIITNFTATTLNFAATTHSNATCTLPGWFGFTADMSGDGVATTPEYYLLLKKNGVEVARARRDTGSVAVGSMSVQWAGLCAAGDDFSVWMVSDGNNNFDVHYCHAIIERKN